MKIKFSRYKKIISWSLTICCLAYIVWFFLKNTEEMKLVFKLKPLMLIILTCLFLLSDILYSLRFRIILKKSSGQTLPFWLWYKMIILGRFLTAMAPQAGNVYLSVYLKKNYQISYTRYASSFFSFTWLDTCLNMIYTIAVVLAVNPGLRLGSFKALNILLLLTIAIAAAPLLLELIFRKTRLRMPYLSWLHSKLSEMLTVSVNNLSDGLYMLKLVITGIISFINTIIIFYICFISLKIPASLPILALFYVILRLSTQIVITPGNLGIRELAYGILSKQMNIGMAQGIVISVIIRVLSGGIIIVLGALFGGIDLLRHRKDYEEPEQ